MAYKAFTGKEQKTNFVADCWVSELDNRMDAEFYWNKADAVVRDVATIQKSVTELLQGVNEEYAHLVKALDLTQQGQEFIPVVLADVLRQEEIREPVESNNTYKLVGVRWWGAGAFIREEKSGREIKGKHLWRVLPDRIIYNRLFAFRGSFAVVDHNLDGCYASSEFPMFAVKAGVTVPNIKSKYIVHCLNSPNYLKVVDKLSTGSTKTSRNRFKEDRFLEMTILMPRSDEIVRDMVVMLNRADALRAQQQSLLERVKELREGIGRLLPSPELETLAL